MASFAGEDEKKGGTGRGGPSSDDARLDTPRVCDSADPHAGKKPASLQDDHRTEGRRKANPRTWWIEAYCPR